MKKQHQRKSTRLRYYNYSQPGYYFVTVCSHQKQKWFGNVKNNLMMLNEWGNIIHNCWHDLTRHYWDIQLDEFVIMPNHVHGIIIIRDVGEGLKPSPTKKLYGLPEVMRGFKTFSSRCINEKIERPFSKFKWQRSFYDHVIRKDESLETIRKYMINNIKKWELHIT